MNRFFCYLFVLIALNTYGNAIRHDSTVFPMTSSKVEIPLDFKYTKQEFAMISQGLIPKDMDDRWIIVVEDGHIYFYRSWTGIMIYECAFEEGEDIVSIFSMYANRNANEYSNSDDEMDVLLVKDLLDMLATRNP